MNLTVASYGGGLNSTAMLIKCVELGIKLDLILFADTGGERPDTYCHVVQFSKWLVEQGQPEITWVGQDKSLEQDCLDRKALPSLAYGFKSCSEHFKIRPQNRFMKTWEPAVEAWKRGEQIVKLVGYDADEPHRMKRNYDDKRYKLRYLLVELDMGREACAECVEKAGVPVPGKSSCFFCPSMTKGEIRRLAHENSELMERALKIERNADLHKIPGLGRKFSWEKFLEQGDLFPEDYPEPYIDVACGCYDG